MTEKIWPIIKSMLKNLPLAVAVVIIAVFCYQYSQAYLAAKVNLGTQSALAQIAQMAKQGKPFEYTFNFSQDQANPDVVSVVCEQKKP